MNIRDLLLGILAIAIWGLHSVVIKVGVHEVPPLFLLLVRLCFMTAVFAPFMRLADIRPLFFPLLRVALFMNALTFGLVFLSLNHIDVSSFSILLESQALLAIPVGYVFFREKADARTVLGIITGICGLVVVTGAPQMEGKALGVLLSLSSALSWTVGSAFMKSLPPLPMASFTAATTGLAIPFVAAGTLLLESGQREALEAADPVALGGVLLYQVFLTALALFLWKLILGRNAFSKVNPLRILMPFFGIAGGIVFLGEEISARFLIGAAIALLGVGAVTLHKRPA